MQMFQHEAPTLARIDDVEVLSQKNREPGDAPGLKFKVIQKLDNGYCAMFDGALKGFLFCKLPKGLAPPQAELDGVEQVSDKPNLTSIGKALGKFAWDWEGTGYTLAVEHGTGGRSTQTFAECIVGGVHMKGIEGGSFEVSYWIECPNATESQFGKAAKLKSRDIPIMLTPPDEDAQASIGDGDGDGEEGGDPKPKRVRRKAAAEAGAGA